MRRGLGFMLAFMAAACPREPGDASRPAPTEAAGKAAPPEGAAWLLSGTDDERFATIAKHLRGFDVAMVETGYRYAELYWAGQDQNWDYAKYQIEKIRTAVNNGVERRPKRARSARAIEGALVTLEESIHRRDPQSFRTRFDGLTNTCNTCHEQERVPFVHVRPPPLRTSVVGPMPSQDGPR